MAWFHTAAGLVIASDRPLPAGPARPEAVIADPATADLVIADAADPPEIGSDGDASGPNWCIRRWNGARGLWMIHEPDGRAVWMTRPDRLNVYAPDPVLRDQAWMTAATSGLAAALLLRGRLPLHAAAVVMAGQAILIAGASGRGKSTLAAALVGAGGQVIADDMVSPMVTGGRVVAAPVLPRLRLMADAAGHFGLTGPVAPDGKILVTPAADPLPDPVPVAALLLLGDRGDGPARSGRLAALAAVPAIRGQITGGAATLPLYDRTAAFSTALLDLARHMPVLTLSLPEGLGRLDEVSRTLPALIDQAPAAC
ncbi:hypothetical protein [Tistrella mobilis]|uniref:HPr kinase n=1 Tax=Tistrella mobilis (strain KA081020-065) TaxID=1110502 RepID=I3TT04_TISMK|nr:hypothetical protein [Tistrella mobilis]AFK55892.1 hypothetical protein TMO_a0489 [Tistrella mobilis KA081020-065]